MNRIDRLTGTLLLLQSQRGLTAERIAAHWEISVRTVYRDLAALAEIGVPVVFDPERGYTLMNGYRVPPIRFTDAEAAALFVAGTVTEGLADRTLRDPLRSALLKIRTVLPEPRRDYLSRLRQTLGVWPARTGQTASSGAFMPIQDAVLRRHCLAIRYDAAGRGTITARTVEPLGLLFYTGHWHLIAYCRLRQDFRDFRLDRMVDLERLDETFRRHEDFSIEDFLDKTLADRERIPVTLTVDRGLAERFRCEAFGTALREESLDADRLRITLQVCSLEGLAGWLLGFGQGLRVESPSGLRDQVRRQAEAVMRNHTAAHVRVPTDTGLTVHFG